MGCEWAIWLPRVADQRVWIPVVVLLGMLLLALARNVFEARFFEFLRLAISDKYINVYRDPSYLLTSFSIFLFFVQLFAFAMLIQLWLQYYGEAHTNDLRLFIRLVVLLFCGILIKFLFDRILGVLFKVEDVLDQFNLSKLSYRSYAGVLLFPLVCALYFMQQVPVWALYTITVVLLSGLGFTYITGLRKFQKVVFGHLPYFILYLCLVEFSPYLLLYSLISKNQL